MSEIEKLKLHLKQAMEIAYDNIEKAENIDLEDMSQTLESFIDELDDIGDFETYGDLDEGFIRMNQLAGVITENQAKKMMEILEEKEITNELFGFGKKSPFKPEQKVIYTASNGVTTSNGEYIVGKVYDSGQIGLYPTDSPMKKISILAKPEELKLA